jgi:outer membrane protein OmpA-like peptidoglycan-associated protein
LLPLAERQEVAADLQIYPSRFHFPNYAPESKLPPATIETLRLLLKQTVFHFDPGNYYLLNADVPKLNAAVTAIAAAGRDARVIVGGYQEADGDPKAQQQAAVRRCETVIAEFKDRGLPTSWFEMTIYSPLAVPNDGGHHRVVELLLK